MPRIRLVKVIVQPVLVLDDGEHITDVEHPPVVVSAAEWPTYSGERFPQELREWQARIDAEPVEMDRHSDAARLGGTRAEG